MRIELSLRALAAWSPGLESADAWKAWARTPQFQSWEGVAAAQAVPPMLRRRLDPLGRAALHVAAQVVGERTPGICLFVSRRGEAQRTQQLLEAIRDGEALSPTSFALSVHNGIAAQYSMWRSDRSGYAALAACAEGVEHAMVEIAARLHERPESDALLVAYDEPVPPRFAADAGEAPHPPFAWAARLGRRAPNDETVARLELSLEHGTDDAAFAAAAPKEALPTALQVLRCLWLGTPEWSSSPDCERRWLWRLHA